MEPSQVTAQQTERSEFEIDFKFAIQPKTIDSAFQSDPSAKRSRSPEPLASKQKPSTLEAAIRHLVNKCSGLQGLLSMFTIWINRAANLANPTVATMRGAMFAAIENDL